MADSQERRDPSLRKIIQIMPATTEVYAAYRIEPEETPEAVDDDEEYDAELEELVSGYDEEDEKELHRVELWLLVEHLDGTRTVEAMSANDVQGGHFCTDAVNFIGYFPRG